MSVSQDVQKIEHTISSHSGSDSATSKIRDEIDKFGKKEFKSLVGSAEKQAVKQFSENADALIAVAHYLPDGAIKPQQYIDDVQKLTGKKLNGKTVDFLEGFDSITKNGNHIDLHRSSPDDIELNGRGEVSPKSINIGTDLSFNLGQDKNGNTELSNIQGLNVTLNSPAGDLNSSFQNITVKKGADGHSVFDASLSNPLSTVAPFVDPNSSLHASFELGSNGKPKLLSKPGISDVLAGVPIFAAANQTGSDLSSFFNNPSLGGAATLGGDAVKVAVAPAETVIDGATSLWNAL